MTANEANERAQLVLLAAAVIALALVPMVFAYMQMGYHGDIGTETESGDRLVDAERSLERAVRVASADIDGEYYWKNRDEAVDEFHASLAEDIQTIVELAHTDGIVIEIESEPAIVESRNETACPSGPRRSFESCETAGNVLVQERAGEVAIIGAAYEIRVTGPDSRAKSSVMVNAFGD